MDRLGPEAVAGVGWELLQLELEDLGEGLERWDASFVHRHRPPSSRATVVKAASSSPQADPLGERGRVEVDVERVAVGRHPLGGIPIEAIFRGGGVSQTPVSPSIRSASTPSLASVSISASSRSRQ